MIKSIIGKGVELRRKANYLINIKNQIIEGEYEYRGAISILEDIKCNNKTDSGV